MKRFLLLTVLSLLISCSGKKQVEKALNTGNYDYAIQNALSKLENNKDKKRKYAYAVMLQKAYYKVVERDLMRIDHLKKDNNPELYREIYETYVDIDARQEAIKPILPLKIDGKVLSFKFNDYSDEIIAARTNVSDYLYEQSLALLESDDKLKIREAYNTLSYIESINPNYDDTRELLIEAHERGTDHVIVSIENRTNQVIPAQLEEELLNFNNYGLKHFWTAYHTDRTDGMHYDYAINLQMKRINISPEHIKERQLLREREIADGWDYLLDENGNVEKDSLGNDIKVDKVINVRARFFEIEQHKASQVVADVVFIDLNQNYTLDVFTIDSGFEFVNLFGRYRGDKRALTQRDLDILNNPRVPFPSNEQMVYDSGEDLKLKFKNIIANNY